MRTTGTMSESDEVKSSSMSSVGGSGMGEEKRSSANPSSASSTPTQSLSPPGKIYFNTFDLQALLPVTNFFYISNPKIQEIKEIRRIFWTQATFSSHFDQFL